MTGFFHLTKCFQGSSLYTDVVAYISTSFLLWLSYIPLYTSHILFIQLSVDEYLSCLYFLAITNNDVMNTHVLFLCGCLFILVWGIYLVLKLLDHRQIHV